MGGIALRDGSLLLDGAVFSIDCRADRNTLADYTRVISRGDGLHTGHKQLPTFGNAMDCGVLGDSSFHARSLQVADNPRRLALEDAIRVIATPHWHRGQLERSSRVLALYDRWIADARRLRLSDDQHSKDREAHNE